MTYRERGLAPLAAALMFGLGGAGGCGDNRDPVVEDLVFGTVLDSTPPALTNDGRAAFAFHSDVAASFQCRVDDVDPVACASPFAVDVAEGPHTVVIIGVADSGAVDATPPIYAWVVDLTPPETTLISAPGVVDNSLRPRFEFSASEVGATFECSLDDQPFAPCTSPTRVDVAAGAHAMQIRAVDAAGNADATPIQVAWTVDPSTPDTEVTVAPSGTIGPGDVDVEFASPTPGATFECSIDTSLFAPCTSPLTLHGLGDGPHAFQVRAVNAAHTVDASPATRIWFVDAIGPVVTFDAEPPSPTDAAVQPLFAFTASEPATFECAIDAEEGAACLSPFAGPLVGAGEHTLRVRATDVVGNLGTATSTWLTAPETTIDSFPTKGVGVGVAGGLITFSSPAAAATFRCSIADGPFTPCTSPTDVVLTQDGFSRVQVAAVLGGVADPSPAEVEVFAFVTSP